MKREQVEFRTFSRDIRMDESGTSRSICGYAVRFNEPSQPLSDGIVEVVLPNAFGDLTGKDVRAFFNHDYNYLLGRTTSGTLKLTQDEVGLYFEINLATGAKAEEVYQLVKRGDLDGVSFGAIVREDRWSADGKTNELMTLDLIEISPVVFPAYLNPNVEARSIDRHSRRPKQRYRSLDIANAKIALDDES